MSHCRQQVLRSFGAHQSWRIPLLLAHIVPFSPVDQLFTYCVPDEMADDAVPGVRVIVPFGIRTITGIIAEVEEGDGKGLKDILDIPDPIPAFSPDMMRLTRWISGYYVSSWGEVLKAALPAGISVESKQVVRLIDSPNNIPEDYRALLRHAGDRPVVVEALQKKGLTMYRLNKLAEAGHIRFEQELNAPKANIRTIPYVSLVHIPETPPKGIKQRAILDVLTSLKKNGIEASELAEVLRKAGASRSSVNTLEKNGIVSIVEKETIRTPFEDLPEVPLNHRLHHSQKSALNAITDELADESQRTFLLHGVTGSGKTEIYIRALRETLQRGKTGIVLVPEIALTPQTVSRFRAHFGDQIAVLHSRMSHGERYDAWRNLRSGRFTVAIGPRSAIFAPLENVGLIIVDEEHESSYKQMDPAPRYHARDVAVMRAHMENAVCILGSATPSLESFHNAQRGKYTLLSMPERVPVAGHDAAPLPTVQIVDLAREYKIRRLPGTLSHQLKEAIKVRLKKKEGIILLQNRRGFSPFVTCKSCGHTPECPHCAVSLTYHRYGNKLTCHYCGHTERQPGICPECGEDDLAQIGVGTQRVEDELQEIFPEARILRMDMDTTSRKNAHHRILKDFGDRKADILLGTQMVAKGLDFPHVTLVGIVDADTSLFMPDFRAAERTFQLLMQVAGRTGRGDLRGEVILQTRRPDHAAIRFATTHDYAAFVHGELAERRELGYPPFGRMANVEFRGTEESATREYAQSWTDKLLALKPIVDVYGPQTPVVTRIKQHFRFHTLLKAPEDISPNYLPRIISNVGQVTGHKVRVAIDIDPQLI